MVYRLDAMDAYNKHLVKKIEVVGVEQKGTTGTQRPCLSRTDPYLYRQPQARINFDVMRKRRHHRPAVESGQRRLRPLCWENGGLEEYSTASSSTASTAEHHSLCQRRDVVETGQMIGKTTEDVIRRNQIRETIQEAY